jgi:hypothetical protein
VQAKQLEQNLNSLLLSNFRLHEPQVIESASITDIIIYFVGSVCNAQIRKKSGQTPIYEIARIFKKM